MKYVDRIKQKETKENEESNTFTNNLNKYYMIYRLNQIIFNHNKKEREYAKIQRGEQETPAI